jgi:acyl carrier protein
MTFTLRRQPELLTGTQVLERLRRRLPGPMRSAQIDTLLTDLPIDSLDTVELLCLIDDEFHVRLGESEFQSFRTVGDLANVVARTAAPGAQS